MLDKMLNFKGNILAENYNFKLRLKEHLLKKLDQEVLEFQHFIQRQESEPLSKQVDLQSNTKSGHNQKSHKYKLSQK